MEKLFIQKIFRIFAITVIFIVIAVLGYLAGGMVKYKIDVRKADKSAEHFQNSLEEPYKKDIYGGKTPEETWGMFLEALKKEDIELASKYFEVGKQEKERQELFQIKQDKKIETLIKIYSQELKLEQKQDDKSYFYILREDIVSEKVSDSIIFYLNPYTKVWKIVSL